MVKRIAVAAALALSGLTLAAGFTSPAQARVFVAVGVPFGVPFYYPGPYAYPPAYYAPPVYYTAPAAPVATAPQYWYYCDNPQGYYPTVPSCSTGWRQVAPTPTPPAAPPLPPGN